MDNLIEIKDLKTSFFTSDGELRAVGDVLVDQLAYMRRCGFDAFEPDQQFDMDDVKAAFERWPEVYQNAADDRTPIWTKRHA